MVLTQASENHLDTCDAQFETDQVDYTYHDMVGYKNICNEYRNILRHKLESELHTFIQDLKYAQKFAGTFKTQLADCYRECTVAEYHAQIQLYTEYQRLYRESTDRYDLYYSDQTAGNIMNDNLSADLKHTINTFYRSLVKCKEWLESCLHRYGERLDEAYDSVGCFHRCINPMVKVYPKAMEYRFKGKFYPETLSKFYLETLILFKMSMLLRDVHPIETVKQKPSSVIQKVTVLRDVEALVIVLHVLHVAHLLHVLQTQVNVQLLRIDTNMLSKRNLDGSSNNFLTQLNQFHM
ncbi:unnamed protein product [Medioppia subpectinata]|uniref:Uncharacterized protein n=1 Tax=Medioppia subpectinata TaxID=1979941 RepID=A0A7R9KX17_9ACAR|nr:unnamed protein product [Medioppia subpectinata]CAG2110343.1 unnamed protein product [Medioppia subpectinata]